MDVVCVKLETCSPPCTCKYAFNVYVLCSIHVQRGASVGATYRLCAYREGEPLRHNPGAGVHKVRTVAHEVKGMFGCCVEIYFVFWQKWWGLSIFTRLAKLCKVLFFTPSFCFDYQLARCSLFSPRSIRWVRSETACSCLTTAQVTSSSRLTGLLSRSRTKALARRNQWTTVDTGILPQNKSYIILHTQRRFLKPSSKIFQDPCQQPACRSLINVTARWNTVSPSTLPGPAQQWQAVETKIYYINQD